MQDMTPRIAGFTTADAWCPIILTKLININGLCKICKQKMSPDEFR